MLRSPLADGEAIEEHQIQGILMIGGWSGYESAYRLFNEKGNYPAFNIPFVCLPATINNNLPGWQNTLQGKAKELFELFEKVAKPQGYGLKATIINFPGGVPGDVGFFLTWEPPVE